MLAHLKVDTTYKSNTVEYDEERLYHGLAAGVVIHPWKGN